MDVQEAREWLAGNRSWTNLAHSFTNDPLEREVQTARWDAATTEQAYWIVKAWMEGMTT